MLAAVGGIALMAGCRTDVTAIEDQTIGEVWPVAQLDTSFVGDTVVAAVPLFLTSACPFLPTGDPVTMLHKLLGYALDGGLDEIPPSCGNVGNLDLTWFSSNPGVSVKAGEAKQHVTAENDVQFTRFASLTVGDARLDFDASVRAAKGVFYFHDITVLPVPDRIDVPDVVSLAVGQSISISAAVRKGTGPRVTTGAFVWGPGNSIASIVAVDTVFGRIQSDGRIAASSTNTLTLKGLAAGEMTLPVVFKKSVSMFNIPGVLAAPAVFSKNVTVIVGGSVRIASNPPGPLTDPANSSAPLTVGGTRQYQLLDQNSATIANSSIKWETSSTNISLDANGTAKCLAPGTANIKATRTGTTLSATVTLQCVASTVVAPTISVSTTNLQIQAGQTASVIATVNNAAGTSPVQWTSKDPTIVSVSPANVAALSTGAATTFKGEKAGGPVDVVATYTANGVTVSATVSVTVTTAPSGNVVVAMWLDPVTSEYTSNGGNFYRARLFDSQGNEVSATSDGGSITYASSDTTVIKIDASSGLATAKKRSSTGTTTLTAAYTKSGQTVATTASPVTVNPDGTAGNAGAVQFSITGDVRRLKVGQVIQFSVVVRDQNGIQLFPGQVSLSLVFAAPLQITSVASTGGFFYNMTATALPTSSAIAGIANVVFIKAVTTGASATVPIVIVP